MATQTKNDKSTAETLEGLLSEFFAKANAESASWAARDFVQEYQQLAEQVTWLKAENTRLRSKIQLLQELCLPE